MAQEQIQQTAQQSAINQQKSVGQAQPVEGQESMSLLKKWWLWLIIALVVIGIGLGIYSFS